MMILKSTRVAVESLVYIAAKSATRPVSAREVAQALSVSLAYLEGILRILREHKLVRSFKGPGGGYQVDGDLEKITVLDVVQLFESTEPKSEGVTACDGFVADFHDAFKKFLSAKSLRQLVGALAPHELVVAVAKPRFGLRPLPVPSSPRGPNSVFQLHAHGSGLLNRLA